MTRFGHDIFAKDALETFLSPWGTATPQRQVMSEASDWGAGVYMLGDIQRTGIVVVHHLPKTPDTVWFRILGKGKV